jgi:hypothetical protein
LQYKKTANSLRGSPAIKLCFGSIEQRRNITRLGKGRATLIEKDFFLQAIDKEWDASWVQNFTDKD